MATLKGFEIGINFIVIIVVAVLILTLGITWIQGVFKSVGSMTDQITAKAHENLMNDLQSGNAKMGFTVPNSVVMKKEESGKFEVGVKNEMYEGKCFSVYAVLATVDQAVLSKYGCTSFSSCTGLRAEVMRWFATQGTIWVNGQEVGNVIVDVKPPRNAPSGRFIFKINADYAPLVNGAKACDEYTGDFSERYESKQLEIKVE